MCLVVENDISVKCIGVPGIYRNMVSSSETTINSVPSAAIGMGLHISIISNSTHIIGNLITREAILTWVDRIIPGSMFYQFIRKYFLTGYPVTNLHPSVILPNLAPVFVAPRERGGDHIWRVTCTDICPWQSMPPNRSVDDYGLGKESLLLEYQYFPKLLREQ